MRPECVKSQEQARTKRPPFKVLSRSAQCGAASATAAVAAQRRQWGCVFQIAPALSSLVLAPALSQPSPS